MTMPMPDLTAALKAKSTIDADDTLAVRRAVWPDGKLDAGEIDAVFDLNDAVNSAAPEWVDFFAEAVAAWVVRQQQPIGYVDEGKAAWLMARIDRDGRVGSLGELEALVKVLEDATNAPDTLKAYALAQIERVVITGDGPTRDGGAPEPGVISPSEVVLLRRLLNAQAGDGPASISRAEAELLFRIKDATLEAANAPDWPRLFVQSVGCHLMAHSDYQPLTRERAAELDAFMADTRSSVGGFLRRLLRFEVGAGVDHLLAERAPVDHDAAVAADRAVTAPERVWLKAQVDADGARDPMEDALLAFLTEESGETVIL